MILAALSFRASLEAQSPQPLNKHSLFEHSVIVFQF